MDDGRRARGGCSSPALGDERAPFAAGARVGGLGSEVLVAITDTILSRNTVTVRSRINGWRCAGGLPRRTVPPGAVDSDIGFVESLRLRWAVR